MPVRLPWFNLAVTSPPNGANTKSASTPSPLGTLSPPWLRSYLNNILSVATSGPSRTCSVDFPHPTSTAVLQSSSSATPAASWPVVTSALTVVTPHGDDMISHPLFLFLSLFYTALWLPHGVHWKRALHITIGLSWRLALHQEANISFPLAFGVWTGWLGWWTVPRAATYHLYLYLLYIPIIPTYLVNQYYYFLRYMNPWSPSKTTSATSINYTTQ